MTLKDSAKHATDVQKLKLKVNQVVMRVYQANIKKRIRSIVSTAQRDSTPTTLIFQYASNVQLDTMPRILVPFKMTIEKETTGVLGVPVVSMEQRKKLLMKRQDVKCASLVDLQIWKLYQQNTLWTTFFASRAQLADGRIRKKVQKNPTVKIATLVATQQRSRRV
jgi:hypothetical protein